MHNTYTLPYLIPDSPKWLTGSTTQPLNHPTKNAHTPKFVKFVFTSYSGISARSPSPAPPLLGARCPLPLRPLPFARSPSPAPPSPNGHGTRSAKRERKNPRSYGPRGFGGVIGGLLGTKSNRRHVPSVCQQHSLVSPVFGEEHGKVILSPLIPFLIKISIVRRNDAVQPDQLRRSVAAPCTENAGLRDLRFLGRSVNVPTLEAATRKRVDVMRHVFISLDTPIGRQPFG